MLDPSARSHSFARRLAGVLSLCALASSAPAASAETETETVIKVATIMPDDTPLATMLSTVAAEWRAVSGGQVTLTAYTGGAKGDEKEIRSKLSSRQLQGAVLTTLGLSRIDSASMVLELPLFIQGKAERDLLLGKMAPEFESALAQKGYVVLAWMCLGDTYLVSKTPIATLADARKAKLYHPETSTPHAGQMIAMGFQLKEEPKLTTLLEDFTNDKINAAFLPLSLARALKLHTQAKYISNRPWSRLYGAFIVTKDIWARIAPDRQLKLKQVAVAAAAALDDKMDRGFDLFAMLTEGAQIVDVTDSAKWNIAADMYFREGAELAPPPVYQRAQALLQECKCRPFATPGVLKDQRPAGPSDLVPGSEIALYSPAHGRFVRINDRGGVDASGKVEDAKLPPEWKWERFMVVDGHDGFVGLFNPSQKRFLRIKSDGSVDAGAVLPGPNLARSWTSERFFVVEKGKGQVALYSWAHQRYLRMLPTGAIDTSGPFAGPADLDPAWEWERFVLVRPAAAK